MSKSATASHNAFGARADLATAGGTVQIYRLDALARAGVGEVQRLPYSIRVLLESLLRNVDGLAITEDNVARLASWQAADVGSDEVPFKPARVLLQDFTGVPAVVDLAALRDALKHLGGDPQRINPLIPVDLVIDHSVQVDRFGSSDALELNAELEFQRNRERYELLHWAQHGFDNFRVIPPATGIIHQVNLEYLATVVAVSEVDGVKVAMPDSLVGTDSHTTMINGLGVVGWGVGGIEAEAVMLGQPIYMLAPQVVGFKLTGRLPEGATATDLVLTVTEMLRAKGVVGKFVEYYGDGVGAMSLADRATVANMAPEYGATMGFFPVDDQTLDYLRRTGRPDELIDLVERYTKEQGLFRADDSPEPEYSDRLTLDISTVQPSLAGPKRPQDRIVLGDMKRAFHQSLRAPIKERGFALDEESAGRRVEVDGNGSQGSSYTMGHGSVVVAAITSCTNTSNPSVMIAAGLLAKNAAARGLTVKPQVKTSLAPGSRVVTEYLIAAGLLTHLETLGFHVVGYGCTTCIGNTGPLPELVSAAIQRGDLVACSVLSGNRNFEGRIHSQIKANYLASPPLVVAYALAGTVDIDLATDPLGCDSDGQPVFLKDIWPDNRQIADTLASAVTAEQFKKLYADVAGANERWNRISSTKSHTYAWDAESTYIQHPPFFEGLSPEPTPPADIRGARVLALLGDSITTDHISPAGAIKPDSPAGQYLQQHGVKPQDFNTYGARRGNDRIMTRGTFANVRLRNRLAPGTEGGVTLHLPTGQQMSIYEAAMKYKEAGTPLIVLAGKEYGTGSSRDWAAKGALLLGVRAVLAQSYERIHRSNLVFMGVLPLQFQDGDGVESLGLTGHETYDIALPATDGMLQPRQEIKVRAAGADGRVIEFTTIARLDTPVDADYYRNGGILQAVLRRVARQ